MELAGGDHMRPCRKAGLLRPFYRTITIKGQADGCYCDVVTGANTSARYYGSSNEYTLKVPAGAVIILYATGAASSNALLAVNGLMIKQGTGTMSLRYVVASDATIEFGFDTSYPASINVTCSATMRFTVGTSAHIARNDMTWGEWIEGLKYIDHTGSTTSDGFFISTSGNKIMYGKDNYNGYFTVCLADQYTIVTASDFIRSGHNYWLDIIETS